MNSKVKSGMKQNQYFHIIFNKFSINLEIEMCKKTYARLSGNSRQIENISPEKIYHILPNSLNIKTKIMDD